MHPVCFEVGNFKVHWFGVFMAFGFLAGLLNWRWLARREGRSFNYCSDLLCWVMVSGILGARLAYVVSDLDSFLAEPLTIVRVDQGGLIYYGGFAGAAAGVMIFARLRDERIWSVFDFVLTSVPLAHAFGRVGCFLNGCCFGTPHGGPLAVRYPAESLVWWSHLDASLITRFASRSLPVYPVQLYEALYNLAVYAVLIRVYRRHARQGAVTGMYLLAYSVGRFFLEFLRGDERARYGTPLCAAQYLSILLFAVGCGLLVRTRGRASH